MATRRALGRRRSSRREAGSRGSFGSEGAVIETETEGDVRVATVPRDGGRRERPANRTVEAAELA